MSDTTSDTFEGLIFLGIFGIAYETIYAQNLAHTQLKKKADSEPCIECGDIPCFPGGPTPQDRAETQAELNKQEEFINSMSPQEMRKRILEADGRKKQTGSYRPEGDAADRALTRKGYYQQEVDTLRLEKIKRGIPEEQAEEEAKAETDKKIQRLDAAHIIDSIIGGNKEDACFMSMGPRGANRRVGSAWARKGRRQALFNAVKNAIKTGKHRMDIHLEVCEENMGTDPCVDLPDPDIVPDNNSSTSLDK
ncbi:polymorphic toxin type 15 domain-containing protein [Swingsia samuiensis]|uniref:Novel toxin 15 domain-containing protein n=1 Tax=Swingsia samuiensis TaxID=1293412 RepID=A0A4Y6UKG1_9PROT|nr:polymorphic toxin type 15 domain-containing protein [Swingsia samuiensis]QDH18099.1 hypothetical protein E3D00_10385 [Swingsia samuiensis]